MKSLSRLRTPRLLLIEDDPGRIERFRLWTPQTTFTLIEATSGGQAMGVTAYGGDGIAGICLDHDLNSQPKTEMDNLTSGTQVVGGIIRNFSRSIPVLVHSMNDSRAELMVIRLKGAGFCVTRIRMAELNASRFANWLQDVSDYWTDQDVE